MMLLIPASNIFMRGIHTKHLTANVPRTGQQQEERKSSNTEEQNDARSKALDDVAKQGGLRSWAAREMVRMPPVEGDSGSASEGPGRSPAPSRNVVRTAGQTQGPPCPDHDHAGWKFQM